MRFDREGNPIPEYPRPLSIGQFLVILGGVVGLVMVAVALSMVIRTTPGIPTAAGTPRVMEVRIVEDFTDPTPRPTYEVCQPGRTQPGDICRHEFTPTPVPGCPSLTHGGLCIYDGPESLRDEDVKATLYPGAGGGQATLPEFS